MPTRVVIIPSKELGELRLGRLVGRTGKAVRKAGGGHWVRLDRPFQDENEWFIPNKSVQVQEWR